MTPTSPASASATTAATTRISGHIGMNGSVMPGTKMGDLDVSELNDDGGQLYGGKRRRKW